MASGDYRMGLDGKFMFDSSGAQAATEVDNVENVQISMSARSAEAIRRGKNWVAKKVTIKEASVTFDLYDIEGDPFMAAIKNAFMNGTRIALYPTTRTKEAGSPPTYVDGEGLDADYYITEFNRAEDNSDFVKYSAKAEPTDEERDPVWQ